MHMRKRTLFLPLIVSIGTLSIAAPTLVCCNKPEEKWDGYTIIEKQLYKSRTGSEDVLLVTNDELKEFENKFAYRDNEGILKFEDRSNLTSFMQSETLPSQFIYLFGGSFVLSGARSNTTDFFVNGLLNNEKEIMSHIDCYADGSMDEHFFECVGFDMYLYDVYMDGCDCTQEEYSFYCGIKANSLYCTNCVFTGTQATYTNDTHFINCFFDGTKNKTKLGKAEYSIYIRNTQKSYFENCQFEDVGKAVKIYTDGYQITGGGNYTFKNCDFKCMEDIGNTKACVAVDSSYQTSRPFVLFMYDCTNEKHVNEYPKQALTDWKDFVQDDNTTNPHTIVYFEA